MGVSCKQPPCHAAAARPRVLTIYSVLVSLQAPSCCSSGSAWAGPRPWVRRLYTGVQAELAADLDEMGVWGNGKGRRCGSSEAPAVALPL